jgi:Coenzyme F390 synthetase
MNDLLKMMILKGNIFFPSLLGVPYSIYKNRITKNYFHFNVEPELMAIVNNSIKNIPYYKKNYITPLNSLNEFKEKIHFIDKNIVMKYWSEFVSPQKTKRNTVSVATGGTSGKPLNLLLPRNRYVFELATMYSMWSNIGWNGQIRAVLRNHHMEDNQIFKIDFLKKEIIFDGFNSSDKYYYKVYHTLKKYHVKYIHAYPSSAYQFSRFLHREKLNTSFIIGFLCGSEGLFSEQKNFIESKLGLKIYHWYGHSEKLVLGGYCKQSNLIHIEPTYGFFELVDENGCEITEEGKIGEIVGTTLHNPCMPLIRYRTGDFAEYAGNYCPHCKRYLPLLTKIYGRWDKNKIFRKDNSYITTTALNLHSDLYEKIDGLQYLQEVKGALTVRIIKNNFFQEEDFKRLYLHFQGSLGAGNDVKIDFVNKLEKLPNGKFELLISKLER